MKETFTASSGAVVTMRDMGIWKYGDVRTGDNRVELAGVHVDALREFFRHEEDERIGRWRSKADPAWTAIVQNGSRYIYFRHEDGEHGFSIAPDGRNIVSWAPNLQAIAREYIAAHPPQLKPILLQAQEDGTDEWFTIRTYPGDPGDMAHAEAGAHLLTSQDVPARVIEGDTP